MFPKSKVTEIYCMTDDFCKEFSFQQEKYMIEDKKIGHRNKPNRMSDAEMMVILILFHSGGFRCFKYYQGNLLTTHDPGCLTSARLRGHRPRRLLCKALPAQRNGARPQENLRRSCLQD